MSVANAKRKREMSGSSVGNLEKCKRLKQSSDLLESIEHVRSSDGATTKMLDGSSSLVSEEEDDKVQDTVGVVVLDRSGRVASTVSSGGIALKQPGRVGQ